MPELPEVETVARGLRVSLIGRIITSATVNWPRTIAHPSLDQFRERIVGRRVESVSRRGKYVVMGLDQGYLLIHLKMSGRLRITPSSERLDKHTHTTFDLDDGRQLRFQDVRKFGRLYLVDDPSQITGRLGPEPLDHGFTRRVFHSRVVRRSGRLKSLLLDQTFIAGLGNIYADESLFAARLHPLRRANTLTEEEEAMLYEAIRMTLCRAVENRGTTLDDQGYVDANGQAGAYQEQIAVYGRKGESCPSCGTSIERIVVGGRSTHFCPRCQK
jgi:formamidopyrimidine-DNA glycosylase